MSQIVHRKGSVFEASSIQDRITLLVHACNGQGVWGSGVAAAFKEQFPKGYRTYKTFCAVPSAAQVGLYGHASRPDELDYQDRFVGWLITSLDYGPRKDSPEAILRATHKSVTDMLWAFRNYPLDIHSPRINSGLFNVPWEFTEQLVDNALLYYPKTTWTVWTP